MFRSTTGVNLLNMGMEDREDVVRFCGDFVCVRVSNGGYVGLVFCFRLEARRGFEVLVVAFWALFVEGVLLFAKCIG